MSKLHPWDRYVNLKAGDGDRAIGEMTEAGCVVWQVPGRPPVQSPAPQPPTTQPPAR